MHLLQHLQFGPHLHLLNTGACACRLSRCTNAITGEDSALPRVKPFKYTYEKEIVMYAYYKKLDYFSTECVYAPHAARGVARELVKELEVVRPSAIVDVIRSAEELRFPGAPPAWRGSCLLMSARAAP
jgi:tRNA(Ile)-lysidine synthase TilS/MesJ